MDLISRKSVAEKMAQRRDYVGRPSDPDCIIADEPSVPAVPLDKLCEWLEENAEFPMEVEVKIFYEPTEEPEIKLNRMPNDAERWREKLTKWMEGLDDHE